jgi:glycosyltransferase involved in cell wall biosynthesis
MEKKTIPASPLRIRSYYPNFYSDKLISYVSLRLARFMNDGAVEADVMGICSDKSLVPFKRGKRIYRDAVPPGLAWKIAKRLFPMAAIQSFADRRYLAGLRGGDIAYVWPNASVRLYRKLKARGLTIVSERINTLLSNSKRVLDAEFASLGIPPSHGLTDRAVAEELECMNLSDYIFSPSPGVTGSLLAAGIPDGKIIRTSYGLESHEIYGRRAPKGPGQKVTALFVGSINVRKGVPLLLEAWKKADADARLVVVGSVAPEIKDLFGRAMAACPSIEHVNFVEDLSPLFKQADFFILPSVEEGSPLVTYLALGASLPMIVSEMGGGGVVGDSKEALVIDPHQEGRFVEAIRAMCRDASLRGRMSEASAARALEYTWERVAARRRDALLSKLEKRP